MTPIAVALACLLALSASSGHAQTLLNAELPRLGGGPSVSLNRCPKPRCLVIYLAPWCPVCRRNADFFLSVQDELEREWDVAARIAVGLSYESDLRKYAEGFGPETLLDLRKSIPVTGVPAFIVTDGSGRVLRQWAGVPVAGGAPSLEQVVERVLSAPPQGGGP